MEYYYERESFDSDEQPEKKPTFVSEIFEWLDAVVVSIIVVVLLFTFIFRIVNIEGRSMLQTLHDGDKVIISNMFYKPNQGDIVVVSRNYSNDKSLYNALEGVKDSSSSPIIKRVIATAGQKVYIDFDKHEVYVDDILINEPYLNTPTSKLSNTNMDNPLIVDDNHVFVMGDNRAESWDSRNNQIGQIDVRYVLGHAVFRVFPFSDVGGLK